MKTMFLSDFTILKKSIIQQVVLCFVVAIFLAITMESLFAVVPAVAFTGGLMVAMNSIAFDEQGGWEKYRLSLPLSHNHVVLGRYAFVLVVLFIFTVVGVIFYLFLNLTLPTLNSFTAISPSLLEETRDISWYMIGVTAIIPSAVFMIFLAIILPLTLRFGLTRAIRLIPLIMFLAVILTIVGFKSILLTLPPFLNDFLIWAISPEGTLIVLLLVMVLAIAFYIVSYLTGRKIYAHREF